MAEKIARPRGAGPQRCRFIAEQHLDLFIEFIEASGGGGLDVGQLREQAEIFQTQKELLDPVYNRSFGDCERSRKDHEHDDKRSDHLGRLVVRLIAGHFVESGALPPEEGGLSRRMVPGVLSVLELALGHDVLLEFRQRGEVVVNRLREKVGDEFEWDDYFSDREAQEILAHLLIALSSTFEDYKRRRAWAIDVIDTNLQHKKTAEDDFDWEFGEAHFQTLVEAMFQPLAGAMDSAEKRIAFANAFGEEKMESLRLFLENANLLSTS